MKRISYPPMIIFLDVLFVFLFLLILNNSKNIIEIELPSGELIPNVTIIYTLEDKDYTLDDQEYIPNSNSDFLYMDKCPNNINECRFAHQKYGKDVSIIYSKSLQDKISNLSIIALGDNTCEKIKFFVKIDGSLDHKKMLEENPCLANIVGYIENFINIE